LARGRGEGKKNQKKPDPVEKRKVADHGGEIVKRKEGEKGSGGGKRGVAGLHRKISWSSFCTSGRGTEKKSRGEGGFERKNKIFNYECGGNRLTREKGKAGKGRRRKKVPQHGGGYSGAKNFKMTGGPGRGGSSRILEDFSQFIGKGAQDAGQKGGGGGRNLGGKVARGWQKGNHLKVPRAK